MCHVDRFGTCADGASPKYANAQFLVCPSGCYRRPHSQNVEHKTVFVPNLSLPATISNLGIGQATRLHRHPMGPVFTYFYLSPTSKYRFLSKIHKYLAFLPWSQAWTSLPLSLQLDFSCICPAYIVSTSKVYALSHQP